MRAKEAEKETPSERAGMEEKGWIKKQKTNRRAAKGPMELHRTQSMNLCFCGK